MIIIAITTFGTTQDALIDFQGRRAIPSPRHQWPTVRSILEGCVPVESSKGWPLAASGAVSICTLGVYLAHLVAESTWLHTSNPVHVPSVCQGARNCKTRYCRVCVSMGISIEFFKSSSMPVQVVILHMKGVECVASSIVCCKSGQRVPRCPNTPQV